MRPFGRKKLRGTGWTLAAAFLALAGGPALRGDSRSTPQVFKYVGGTERLRGECLGQLEVTVATLVFVCPEGSIAVPYRSILVMEYRDDISSKVQKMKLNWLFKPWRSSGKVNRYFTVVYSAEGREHAIVLNVSPDDMRPYLAEIDLKAGRRVEVQNHEKYD